MTSRSPLAFIAFSLLVGALCVRLGIWQVERLVGRRASNAAALQQRALPPVDARALRNPTADRRVIATGRYDFDREVVLRGRGRNGVPGVEVVTPLLLSGTDTAILVLRGYVPSADATSYNAEVHREPETATVDGIAMPIPNDPSGAAPDERNGAITWHRLDLGTLRARLPYPLAPVYIIADSPATVSPAPSRVSPPSLDDGPHLNYAIQWFAFASIAFGGAAALWWQRRRHSSATS